VINSSYAQTLFNFLYANIDGYSVSASARGKFNGTSEDLLYGEIPFKTWEKIVDVVKPKADGIFYDLGSGTGRVVMQSYLMNDFKKCIGVELMTGLHDKAVEVNNTFEKLIKPRNPEHFKDRELIFKNENITKTNISDADFILLPHPFKVEVEFLRMEQKFLRELKKGTKIVTLIRSLINSQFKTIGKRTLDFSWGESPAYFFEI